MLDQPAEWTTPTDFGGEDPLAMLRALEVLYQQVLLPGFSSVTTRFRYYSFYAWWLTEYASRKGGQSTSKARFSDHTRRMEALFALTALAHDRGTTGLAGAKFARDKLASESDPIDFGRATDRETPEKQRYLKEISGAFRNIYAGQMTEMGLIGAAEHHSLPVPTKLGRSLADCFAASVGELGAEFLSVAEAGVVSRSDLARLSVFSPVAIPTEGSEVNLLRKLLLSLEGPERMGTRRGSSIRAILEAAAAAEAMGEPDGVSQESLRWRWHAMAEHDDREVIQVWAAYQGGDILRVCYEALLRHASQELEEKYGAGRSLTGLAVDLTDGLGDISLNGWFKSLDDGSRELDFPSLLKRAMEKDASLGNIMAPVSRVARIWAERMDVLNGAFPPEPEGQTLFSELSFLSKRGLQPASAVMSEIFRKHILSRHLRVATRKFHQQGNYTFLIEAESGVLRARASRDPSASGPRLRTAIAFLEDVYLLKDGRITPEGHAWRTHEKAAIGDAA